MPTPAPNVLRFGVFELDSDSGELRRHGLKIRLPDQSFQVLKALLSRPGEVVTREELRHVLWTSDTFVGFEVGLNSAVRKLREALDDDADNPRFVETLPRRGYRFVASVRAPAADAALLSEPAEPAAELPAQIPAEPTTQLATEPLPGAAATAPARSRVALSRAAVVLLVALVAAGGALYQRGELVSRAGPAAEPIRSLVVLPFENLTEDPGQDYFVDGMTDALTTDLAQVGGFDVISRTSAMQYKSAKKLLPAIGQELNVDALVQGSVVRFGQHVRITVQLIQASTDRHVWAQSYEGELSDVLTLQRQIARAIATAIQGRLASPSPARGRGPRAVNPEAYDAYLKGVSVGGRQTYDGFRNAVAYFEDAIARQPDFAEAYAAMARAQLQFLFVGPLSPRETMPKAEAAARKALQLDETLAEAHRTLAAILNDFHWRWEEADKEFRRARELGATSAETQPAAVMSLIRSGHFEEAIALTERARRLDPLSFNAHMNVAIAYRAAGQYERTFAGLRQALEIIPGQSRAHFQLGATLVALGRLNEAIGELETAVRSPQRGNPRFQAYLGYAYAAVGRPLDARRILKELESRARQQYVSSFGIALIHDALGEKEPALAAFERAYQDRAVEFAQMTQYPPFKTIASEPRFQALMRLIGLPR